MRILSLDTTTGLASFALADEKGLAAALSFRHQREVSRRWPLCVQEVLRQAGWELSSLRGIAVCSGPGSFTGLRIGMVAAKTLAQALAVPLVAVSSLELLALPLRGLFTGVLGAALPCRPGEVYLGRFEITEGTLDLKPLGMGIAPSDEVVEGIASGRLARTLVGSLGAAESPLPGGRHLVRSHAEVGLLAREAVERLRWGQGEDPLRVNPVYLKRSQAEEALAAGP